jgi:lipopolysaccharide transport system permease protein
MPASSHGDSDAIHVRVISSRRGWFDWRLDQLWRYRELIGLFVRRDFVSVYAQTILGPAWHVIRPLVTTLLFTLVFNRVAGISTEGAPAFLFYLVGTVAWTYFASSLDGTARAFITHGPLLGKVSFHRLVIPVSIVLSSLIAFAIQFAMVLAAIGLYAATGHPMHLTAWAALLPVQLLILAGFSLGGGIIVCAMTTRYRDLGYIVSFGTQSLMYLTPVIYPVSAIPDRYRWLLVLNPLAPVFESVRRGLLGVGTVTLAQFALSFATMIVVIVTGLLLFTRADRTIMDTV